MYTAGFIGCGSMGGALALAAANKIGGENILLTNHNIEKANALSETTGAKIGSNIEIANSCKFIFLGVKPKTMAAALEEIKPVLQKRTDRFVLVSMAAALPAAHISELSGGFPVLRIMPNTPCAVGEGIILYCPSESVSDSETAEFCSMMELSGMVDAVDEALIDAASAISGCGPAFVYMFIEALSDGRYIRAGIGRRAVNRGIFRKGIGICRANRFGSCKNRACKRKASRTFKRRGHKSRRNDN